MAEAPTLRFLRHARNVWQNSPWVVIAVTTHVIAGATLSIVSWRADAREDDLGPIAIAPARALEPAEALPEPKPLVERTPPPRDSERELVTPEEAVIPYVPTEVDLTVEIGDPALAPDDGDFSPSVSTNIGPGGPGHRGNGPSTRSHGHGIGHEKGGRTPIAPPQATQEAVLYGMRWLVRHQQADGSWSIAKLRDVCADSSCLVGDATYTEHYDEGLTALALLAFLGAGYHHASPEWIVDPRKGRQHRLGDVVKAGLRALEARQKEDGSFSATRPFLYNEALCTMAMCEAYWLSGARPWRASAERAVRFLVEAQKLSPRGGGAWGWRYAPREPLTTTQDEADPAALAAAFESDLSVTTWAIMALKSARLAGLDVPDESLEGALEYVRWVSLADGRAGYLTPDGAGLAVGGVNDHFTYHTAVMSALSMCSRTFVAHDADDPFLEAGARWLVRDLPLVGKDRLSIDYYYWYYGSLALNQFDGPDSPRKGAKYWGPWNDAMAETLVALQHREKEDCAHGAWLAPDRWSYAGGPLYATALDVLTLEVYYRYDNAFGVREERTKRAPSGERGR
ncbi:MAG: hypothetical protein L6Q99_21845 [Planctomycetes bacterium]|nr:hypothetical protein [Planctomycetota bacterium]